MKRFLILSFIFFTSIGFSQENSTNNQVDICLQNSLNVFFKDESFKNIKRNLVVSSFTRNEEIIIRIIPLFNDFYKYNELTGDFKAYFNYNDFNILYYENAFDLDQDENVVLENVLIEVNGSENKDVESEVQILKLNNPEYYGMEFIYIKGELKWNEKSYFESLIENQFLSSDFYKDVIYKAN